MELKLYLATLAAAGVFAVPVLEERQNAAPLNVMIVGDSISQGAEGDWTWRYRIWQWQQDQKLSWNFVGPYAGTDAPPPPEPPAPPPLMGTTTNSNDAIANVSTTGGYAVGVTSGWNSNHFAAWGRQCAQDVGLIGEMVSTYGPDMLLVELGFNDIGWLISDAQGTLSCMENFVNNARSANPHLTFAIANIPQRTFIQGRQDLIDKTVEYNQLLASAIPGWSTSASPIIYVDFASNYDCGPGACPAGHDGLHPNALGDYQIAHAFSLALVNDLKVGSSPLSIPSDIPQRPCPVPSNVVAQAAPDGIAVTWDAVYGAYAYDVQYSYVGSGVWENATVNTNRYDTTATLNGWEWEYQVRTDNGNDGVSDWSGTVSATSYPQVPGPPQKISTSATSNGVDVAWLAPTGNFSSGIIEYAVTVWDFTVESFIQTYGVTSTSASITGLEPGHHYAVWVAAWNENGAGWAEAAYGVVIDEGVPAVPTNLQVTSIDATTISLAWCGDPNAFGYSLWSRNINNNSDYLKLTDTAGTTEATTYGVAFLFPGVWNFEFCVSSFNGDSMSGQSNCVVAPSPGAEPVGGPVGGAGCFSTDGARGGGTSTSYTIPSAPTSGSGTGSGTGSGSGGGSSAGSGTVTIDPLIWNEPAPTVECYPPCTYVLPPLTLAEPTTFIFPVLTTVITVGWYVTSTLVGGNGETYTDTYYDTITETTTITIPPVTTNVISWFEVPVTDTSATIDPFPSVTAPSFIISDPTVIEGSTVPLNTRTFYPPPWPGTTVPPALSTPSASNAPTSTKGGVTTVHHTVGLPGPLCTAGCGHGCSGICAPCWLFCPGPPSGDGFDSNTPGGGGGGEGSGEGSETVTTTPCQTSTFTSCDTYCVVATTTTSCSSECIQVVGCTSPTDQTTTSTATGCAIGLTSYIWTATDGDLPTIGASGPGYMYGFTMSTGVAYSSMTSNAGNTPTTTKAGNTATTTTTTKAENTATTTTKAGNTPTTTEGDSTSTTVPPYPTNTAENVGGAYCFKPSDGNYVEFTETDAKNAISAFCSKNYVLQPGNTYGFVEEYAASSGSVVVAASWAQDQAGCGTEKNFPFDANSADCQNGWSTDFFCANESGDETTSYGGAYVLKPPGNVGCILISLYAYAG